MRTKNSQYLFYILLLLVLIGYCISHTILSQNSLKSIKSLKSQISQQKQVLSSINNKLEDLQKKIDLISSETNPNLDFLEEEAKSKLGLAKKNEKVLYSKNLNQY